ncbi:MAG: carboxynorspermidine decarboxylase [Firmicutes bacterium]|nr:carboxynorspermidine decarboxylase [[Eubacterium] siraeum]MCM1487316.1 carboxynorspermidine decarboxylase [Bacillota bacterium]
MHQKLQTVKTPAYIIDLPALTRNLEILKEVEEKSGAKILLAQKCYSVYQTYPLIGKYISGCTASGLFEARLGFEEMHGENHIFSPAYLDSEFEEITEICDHISFNSVSQYEKFRDRANGVSCGIRINPEFSTQEHGIYDPCSEFSRLGAVRSSIKELPEGLEGLHFHTLCEQNADDLAKTAAAVEDKFGDFLPKIKWLNMGGGHHITRPGYDVDLLVKTVRHFSEKYGVQVYLEPGEAVALNAGWLAAEVLDTVHNGMDIAILDASAACHMPDVIEMPYRPEIEGAGQPYEKAYTYRLGGNTCLAGDIIGDYSFDKPLKAGDKLFFKDMAIYSMVKNNTFNGMALPDILAWDGKSTEVIKSFSYEDFKCRL